MEMLFEQDNEEKSVASLILDALVKVQHHYSILEICTELRNVAQRKKTILDVYFIKSFSSAIPSKTHLYYDSTVSHHRTCAPLIEPPSGD